MTSMSGMSGNNGLDNKPYHSVGAAHYLSTRNIHNFDGGYVDNTHDTNIKLRTNHTHSYITNFRTAITATTAAMTTSVSYE